MASPRMEATFQYLVFFILGVGERVSWSCTILLLPWLSAASENRHPSAPAVLLNSLPATVSFTSQATSTAFVFLIARWKRFPTLHPVLLVPLPIALSALGFLLAGAIAQADYVNLPGLSGWWIAVGSMFVSFIMGALTAVANCGCACISAKAGRPSIRAYNTGQSAAVSLTALLSLVVAARGGSASDPTLRSDFGLVSGLLRLAAGDEGNNGRGDGGGSALARSAMLNCYATAATLLFSLVTFGRVLPKGDGAPPPAADPEALEAPLLVPDVEEADVLPESSQLRPNVNPIATPGGEARRRRRSSNGSEASATAPVVGSWISNHDLSVHRVGSFVPGSLRPGSLRPGSFGDPVPAAIAMLDHKAIGPEDAGTDDDGGTPRGRQPRNSFSNARPPLPRRASFRRGQAPSASSLSRMGSNESFSVLPASPTAVALARGAAAPAMASERTPSPAASPDTVRAEHDARAEEVLHPPNMESTIAAIRVMEDLADAKERASDLRAYMHSIFLVFFFSMLVYPGLTNFLRTAPSGEGYFVERPDLLLPVGFFLYSIADFAGRIMSSYLPTIPAQAILGMAVARAGLVPAILSCNLVPPSGHWALPPTRLGQSDVVPLAMLGMLGWSNGFVFSSSAAAGPSLVPPEERGSVATALVAHLYAGNTLGGMCGVLLSVFLSK